MNAQEALKSLVRIAGESPNAHNIKPQYTALKELVERVTPKKPVGKHTSYKCPVCDRRVRSGKGSSSFGVDNYCQRCGQALDWSGSE